MLHRCLAILSLAAVAATGLAQETPSRMQPVGEPGAAADAVAAGPLDAAADEALRRMSEYLSSLKSFRLVSQNTFDVLDLDGQKLQYTRRLAVDVRRPNRMRGEAIGDDWDKAYWYDGSSVSILDRREKVYSTVPAPDTIDRMFDHMFDRYGLTVPTADLLFNDVYDTLMRGVVAGRHVGMHYVGERLCHHLAFRQNAIDWQIWIDDDEQRPLPRKLVVTYKQTEGSPQFTSVFIDWDVKRPFDDKHFKFEAPEDAFPVETQPLDEPIGVQPPAAPAKGNKP
jgi:hypothetical protein